MLPVIGVRPLEGRVGSTLLMELLASSPEVVCDRRYPVGEYRYLSYCARLARWMGTPFDPQRDVGVTEMLFGPDGRGGPLPWEATSLSTGRLGPRALHGLWDACSAGFVDQTPDARWYAEKLACPVDAVVDAGIEVHVIDIVRDPRDMVASMIAFGERSGPWGFGRSPQQSDADWIAGLVATLGQRLDEVSGPSTVPTLLLRYEDFATDLHGTARLLEAAFGVTLDPDAVLAQRPDHHVTTASVGVSIGRWRSDLPPDVSDALWSALADRLEPLGYTAQ
ncbi:MAG TPA: sulfotransferase [Ilumatobacteraceae bacterium]|nr:sulfotransferase [Ilumatobacteraceae bacterium]